MSFPDHLITRDRVAVALERQIILRHIRTTPTARVLDVGCGPGATLRWLSDRMPRNTLVGLEPNADLYRTAVEEQESGPGSSLTFLAGDHTTVPGKWDYIYTQRMLIQLRSWEAQYEAIQMLRNHLTPEGRLVCVEPVQYGLQKLNAARQTVGLPDIVPPGHTHYLPDWGWVAPGLLRVRTFGQVYSLLSRVVEARRAQQEGREPAYMDPDSTEGRLCLALSEMDEWSCEWFGQYHYSVWGAA